MTLTERSLLRQFKGDAYLFGAGVLPETRKLARQTHGGLAAMTGKRAALVRGTFRQRSVRQDYRDLTSADGLGRLTQGGIELVAQIKGARPNAPERTCFASQMN